MPFTFDPATPRGQVRLIIGDTDSTNPIFDDAAIDAFLVIQDQVVKMAAAQALDSMASSEAYIQKRTKVGDVQTDGPAVAKALREHAATLRQQVAEEVDFDFAEMDLSPWSGRQIMINEWMRNG